MHIAKKFYGRPELAMKVERFALQRLQLLLHDHPVFEQTPGDMGEHTQLVLLSVLYDYSKS